MLSFDTLQHVLGDVGDGSTPEPTA